MFLQYGLYGTENEVFSPPVDPINLEALEIRIVEAEGQPQVHSIKAAVCCKEPGNRAHAHA